MMVMGDGWSENLNSTSAVVQEVVSGAVPVDTCWYRTTTVQASVASKIISKKFQHVPACVSSWQTTKIFYKIHI